MKWNVVLTVAFAFSLFFASVPLGLADHLPAHAPLDLTGDAAVHTQADLDGWPGAGTAADPYVISGYTWDAAASNGIALRFENLDDVHLEITGNHFFDSTGDQTRDGLRIDNAPGVVLADNTFDDSLDDGFLMRNIGLSEVLRNHVGSATVWSSQDRDYTMYAHDNVATEDLFFHVCYGEGTGNVAGDTMQFGTETWTLLCGTPDVSYSDNRAAVTAVDGGRMTIRNMDGGYLYVDEGEDLVIEDSVFTHATLWWSLADTTLRNVSMPGPLRTSEAVRVTIEDSTMGSITMGHGDEGSTTITVQGSTITGGADFTRVSKLTFQDNAVQNFVLDRGVDLVFQDNVVTPDPTQFGVDVFTGDDNVVIDGNTIMGGAVGIRLDRAPNGDVNNNVIRNADTAILATRTGADYDGNDLEGGTVGFHFDDADGPVLTGNRIVGFDTGLLLERGGITAYDNWFENALNADLTNALALVQFFTPPQLGPNIAGGPLKGGNYWSDYAGQDLTGDGFGEEPHGFSPEPAGYTACLAGIGPCGPVGTTFVEDPRLQALVDPFPLVPA